MHRDVTDATRSQPATLPTSFESLEPRLLLSASVIDYQQPLDMIDTVGADTHAHDDTHGLEFPDDDYGNDAENAEQAFLDTTLYGNIDFIGDHDWFAFQGEAGVTYTFTSEIFSLP
ncbi:MAG: LEPR-XLL domain-containing protein, partial [Phycisphaerales bacterium]